MFKFIKNYFKTKKLEKENAENARAEKIRNHCGYWVFEIITK